MVETERVWSSTLKILTIWPVTERVYCSLLWIILYGVLICLVMYLCTMSTKCFVKKTFRSCLLKQWQGTPRQSFAIFLEACGDSGDSSMRRKDVMAWERGGIPKQREYEIEVWAKVPWISTECQQRNPPDSLSTLRAHNGVTIPFRDACFFCTKSREAVKGGSLGGGGRALDSGVLLALTSRGWVFLFSGS